MCLLADPDSLQYVLSHMQHWKQHDCSGSELASWTRCVRWRRDVEAEISRTRPGTVVGFGVARYIIVVVAMATAISLLAQQISSIRNPCVPRNYIPLPFYRR